MTREQENWFRAKVMHMVSGLMLEVSPDDQSKVLEAISEAALTMLASIAPADLELVAYRLVSNARATSKAAVAPPWRPIVAAVADKHGLTVADLIGHRRTQDVVEARQEAMYALRQVETKDGKPRWSLPTIGRMFNRDHTTVLWGVKAHQALLDAAARDAEAAA